MSVRLDTLRTERDEAVAAYEALEAEAGATPTPEQQTQLDSLFARAEALDAEIAPVAERQSKLDAGAAVLAKLGVSRPAPQIVRAHMLGNTAADREPMTAGEYLSLFMRAQGDPVKNVAPDPEATQMIARAVADQKVADVTGIVPKEIVGPLLNLFDATRPVFASLTSRPMPASGKTFSRPQITQHVTVAKNNVEKSESASQKMIIGGTDVTKNVFRGVLDISQESIDWTDPALLQIVLTDFGDVYARVAEAEACAALVAAAVATSPWLATNPGTVTKSITDAVLARYTASQKMPDTLWLSLDAAMDLASLTNADNTVTGIGLIRQSLAAVGLDLKFVIGPQLPAATRILGNAGLVESYEQQKGLIQAVNVPLYGWDIGYAAYLAFFGVPAAFARLVAA